MTSLLRSSRMLRILGLTLALASLAPLALAETVTFLYETKAQGEVEECG